MASGISHLLSAGRAVSLPRSTASLLCQDSSSRQGVPQAVRVQDRRTPHVGCSSGHDQTGFTRGEGASFLGRGLQGLQSPSGSDSTSTLSRDSRRAPRRRQQHARPGTASAVFQWGRRPDFIGTKPRVIVVTSGKGGVGKTTITANLGMCLARLDFKVVAIDCDVGLRNLDLLMGMEARVHYTVQDVIAGEARLDQALVRDKRCANFELLCISKPRSKLDLTFSGKSLVLLVESLREREEGCPDFILLDCPAGIEAGFITAITPANEAVIVTTPDVTCLRDADRVAGLLECDGITDVKLLVNRVRADLIKAGQMMSVGDVREMLVRAPLCPLPAACRSPLCLLAA
eukprot:jgi/Mesen1/168/ME1132893C07549